MGLSWIITFNFLLMKRSNYLHTTIIVLYGSVIMIYILVKYMSITYIYVQKNDFRQYRNTGRYIYLAVYSKVNDFP